MAKKEKWEEFLEANCDGSGPHAMFSDCIAEVRRIPTGGGAGAILCYACYRREIRYREERNARVAHPFALPEWEALQVCATASPTLYQRITEAGTTRS